MSTLMFCYKKYLLKADEEVSINVEDFLVYTIKMLSFELTNLKDKGGMIVFYMHFFALLFLDGPKCWFFILTMSICFVISYTIELRPQTHERISALRSRMLHVHDLGNKDTLHH